MSSCIPQIIADAIAYDVGDAPRIHHFLKVYAFARAIGLREQLDADTQLVLELAAILHDIGIHACEEKYGKTSGPLQEKEGPIIARRMLEARDVSEDVITEVCYIIAHHHTYGHEERTLAHQILIEADWLVNIHEDKLATAQIQGISSHVFRTRTGHAFLQNLYAPKAS